MSLPAIRQRGTIIQLVSAVEAAVNTHKLGPAAVARLVTQANAVCADLNIRPIRQAALSDDQAAAIEAELRAALAVHP